VLREAETRGLPLSQPGDFQNVAGKGVVGVVDGRRVAVGNAALLEQEGVQAVPPDDGHGTVLLVMIDGRYAGRLRVADPIRSTTAGAIQALHAEGLRLIMLTGDSRAAAEAVARPLAMDEIHAEVLPAQKNDVIRRLQSEGRVVAMAGDGINDAPALAQANVGIALGTGTDVAIESAGITLVRPDLAGIVRARRLGKATMRTIRVNLFLAFVYNVLSIPLAAFGILHPIVAAAAMSLSSVSVIGNSLLLRRSRL
jgi:Cu+-exporting ATPase